MAGSSAAPQESLRGEAEAEGPSWAAPGGSWWASCRGQAGQGHPDATRVRCRPRRQGARRRGVERRRRQRRRKGRRREGRRRGRRLGKGRGGAGGGGPQGQAGQLVAPHVGRVASRYDALATDPGAHGSHLPLLPRCSRGSVGAPSRRRRRPKWARRCAVSWRRRGRSMRSPSLVTGASPMTATARARARSAGRSQGDGEPAEGAAPRPLCQSGGGGPRVGRGVAAACCQRNRPRQTAAVAPRRGGAGMQQWVTKPQDLPEEERDGLAITLARYHCPLAARVRRSRPCTHASRSSRRRWREGKARRQGDRRPIPGAGLRPLVSKPARSPGGEVPEREGAAVGARRAYLARKRAGAIAGAHERLRSRAQDSHRPVREVA